jgi:hypothetical protein
MPIRTEQTSYGYRSTIEDPVSLDDMRAWAADVDRATRDRRSFGQLIDVRRADRLSGDLEQQKIIQDQMKLVKERGLLRSCVVVPNRQVALKIKQLAFATPVYEWERYLDGADPDWERLALDWIVRGLDPENRVRRAADDREGRSA